MKYRVIYLIPTAVVFEGPDMTTALKQVEYTRRTLAKKHTVDHIHKYATGVCKKLEPSVVGIEELKEGDSRD